MLKNEVLVNLGSFFIVTLIIGTFFIFGGLSTSFATINRAILIMIGILFILTSISLFKKIKNLKWG
jgi:hypothetical protein